LPPSPAPWNCPEVSSGTPDTATRSAPTTRRSSCPVTTPKAGGVAGTERLLRQAPDLDAIFAASDMTAAGALTTLQRAGRRVPEDVAVAGYDDAAISRLAAMSGYRTTRIGTTSAPPTQVCDHGQVVGGMDTSDRLASQVYTLHQHLLVLLPGAEEDVVDALVDHLRSGFQRCGRMGRRQRDCVGWSLAGAPGVGQHISCPPQDL
jgi:hypothetical protein